MPKPGKTPPSPEPPPAEQQQLIRETVFGPDSPGPVVHDLEALAEFVGDHGLEAAGQHQVLPLKVLTDLNLRMHWRARVELQRPHMHSYPNLQGLYLLARASGLIVLRGTGKKARLARDSEAFDDWRALNDTERYFSLLDAWLLHARAGVIGERSPVGGFLIGFPFDDESFLPYVLHLWQRVGAKGKKLSQKERADANASPPVDHDRYTMVLMALFGLLRVEQGAPVKGRPWTPTAIHRTPFGDAVVSVLKQLAGGEEEGAEAQEVEGAQAERGGGGAPLVPAEVCFDRLRPLFAPYVPSWRESLCVAGGGGFREGVFVFLATVSGGSKDVWRRIAAPAGATLTDLAFAVVEAFRFDEEHLWSFYVRDRFGNQIEVQHDYAAAENALRATSDVRVGEVPLEVGESMTFMYDYGDEWRFDLLLERIGPPEKSKKARPRLLEKHGVAPAQYPAWDE